MDEIRVPQHVVHRFERRWTARLSPMVEGRQRLEHASGCDDPLRSPQVWRLLEGSLDAMVKLFQDQLLKFVGCLPLAGVDSRLSEQTLGIDFGLDEKKPKADILCLQKVVRQSRSLRRALVRVTINFEHHRLYHHKSDVAHWFIAQFCRNLSIVGASP